MTLGPLLEPVELVGAYSNPSDQVERVHKLLKNVPIWAIPAKD